MNYCRLAEPMWTLENLTPFAAERMWVRAMDGAEVWVVAVKGTFVLEPEGRTSVSPEQVDVFRAPTYHASPANSSLRYDVDLVRARPGTDVLLHGQAHAPAGHLLTAMDVSLRIERLEKRLRVFGDRRWECGMRGARMTPPQPFTTMPIVYERAFGGPSVATNPVGKGGASRAQDLDGSAAPNIEDPAALISSWSDRPAPAGFGPLASHWSPRRELAGTYDDVWRAERQPLLPSDFDESHYRCAPLDQQFRGYLRGGEAVELLGFDPDGPIRFILPRVALGMETRFFRGAVVHHRPELHTVTLEPELRRVILVWHSALVCRDGHQLQSTRILVKRQLMDGSGRALRQELA